MKKMTKCDNSIFEQYTVSDKVDLFITKIENQGRNRIIASEDGHLAEELSLPPGGVLLKQCSDLHSKTNVNIFSGYRRQLWPKEMQSEMQKW